MEKEAREKMEEDRKKQRLRQRDEDVKKFLERQVNEKNAREELEKAAINEQADLWKHDNEIQDKRQKEKETKAKSQLV